MASETEALYEWLTNPERSVTMKVNDTYDGIALSWNTTRGRIETQAESQDLVIRKAYDIDQNENPEARIRLAYTPTADSKAWSTGKRHDGKMGWNGHVTIRAKMPAQVQFELPKLPNGWVWEEFGSNIRREKNKRVGYLSDGMYVDDTEIVEGCRFRFCVMASEKVWHQRNEKLFQVICKGIGEVERANFVIDLDWD